MDSFLYWHLYFILNKDFEKCFNQKGQIRTQIMVYFSKRELQLIIDFDNQEKILLHKL